MRRANDRQHYNVTSPLIGWAHTQNDPCMYNTFPCGLYAYNAQLLKYDVMAIVLSYLAWMEFLQTECASILVELWFYFIGLS